MASLILPLIGQALWMRLECIFEKAYRAMDGRTVSLSDRDASVHLKSIILFVHLSEYPSVYNTVALTAEIPSHKAFCPSSQLGSNSFS